MAKAFFCAAFGVTLAACGSKSQGADVEPEVPRVEWNVSVNEPITREHALLQGPNMKDNEYLQSVLHTGMGVCDVSDTVRVGGLMRERAADLTEFDLTYGWLELEDSADCDLVIYNRKPLIDEDVVVEDICSMPEDDMNVLVLFKFADALKWKHITEAYTGKRLAIVVNGEIVNAPIVNSRIDSGSCSVVLPMRVAGRFLPI